MGFLDNTGVARLWQHILVKVNERLTVDPSVVEEGAANLINADSLGGVLAKDYATKADIDAIDILVTDSTLTQEGLAAESKATGTRITALENNKVESINGLTGKNITLDVGTMGAVLKTGDTMSGVLSVPELRVQKGTNEYSSVDYFSASGSYAGGVMMNSTSGSRRLNFKHIHNDQDGNSTKYYDAYQLPTATAGLTNNNYYQILTSKSPVTVAQGGTGASDAATARANLGITPENIGALPLTGGTLTGLLTTPNLTIQHNGQWSQLELGGNGQFYGLYYVDSVNGHLGLRIGNLTSGFYENYHLASDASLTANKDYTILSTKAAVTIAQGGTGSTTLKGARDTLMHEAALISTTAPNANYNGITYSQMPATANGTGDPTGGVMLTAQYSTVRGMQIASGYSANSLKWRFIHSEQTSDAGIKGYSPWYTIYHSGNISTLMTEITNRLSNASGVSF